MSKSGSLPEDLQNELLNALQARFEKNMARHKGIKWADVESRLNANPSALWTLNEMEETGGEPDVVDFDKKSGKYIFFDCVAESPKGRRSFCYDGAALESRKQNKPKNSAVDAARVMGAELLNEDQYKYLQQLGEFDTKTSSWLNTPYDIRKHGGAIFGDRRFNHVFIYHNGAESYYSARGFRCCVRT